jgi:hypothetical protein
MYSIELKNDGKWLLVSSSPSLVFISILQGLLTRNDFGSANLPKSSEVAPSEPIEPTELPNTGTLPQALVVLTNKLVI